MAGAPQQYSPELKSAAPEVQTHFLQALFHLRTTTNAHCLCNGHPHTRYLPPLKQADTCRGVTTGEASIDAATARQRSTSTHLNLVSKRNRDKHRQDRRAPHRRTRGTRRRRSPRSQRNQAGF
ncbi:hypothetical protein GCM10020218_019530 [Dactylosporangium vinaceum]